MASGVVVNMRSSLVVLIIIASLLSPFLPFLFPAATFILGPIILFHAPWWTLRPDRSDRIGAVDFRHITQFATDLHTGELPPLFIGQQLVEIHQDQQTLVAIGHALYITRTLLITHIGGDFDV